MRNDPKISTSSVTNAPPKKTPVKQAVAVSLSLRHSISRKMHLVFLALVQQVRCKCSVLPRSLTFPFCFPLFIYLLLFIFFTFASSIWQRLFFSPCTRVRESDPFHMMWGPPASRKQDDWSPGYGGVLSGASQVLQRRPVSKRVCVVFGVHPHGHISTKRCSCPTHYVMKSWCNLHGGELVILRF